MTLEIFSDGKTKAIAQALGDTADGLTNAEIDEIFELLGAEIPEPGTKWCRIYKTLWNIQYARKDRKATLEFIRKAMDPARHLRCESRFETMRENLNRALALAGLCVTQEGKIVFAQSVSTIREADRRARELRTSLQSRNVHPDVLRFCKAELLNDNYFHAVLEAVKSIFAKIRHLTGLSDDGESLVNTAFRIDRSILAINDLRTASEKSEQQGFAHLIKGVNAVFRNPAAHEPKVEWSMPREDAEDLLSVASFIHRRLDAAKKRER